MKGSSFIKRRITVSLNWQSDVGVAGMNTHSVNNLHSQTQIQTFTHAHTYTRTHIHTRAYRVGQREIERNTAVPRGPSGREFGKGFRDTNADQQLEAVHMSPDVRPHSALLR